MVSDTTGYESQADTGYTPLGNIHNLPEAQCFHLWNGGLFRILNKVNEVDTPPPYKYKAPNKC